MQHYLQHGAVSPDTCNKLVSVASAVARGDYTAANAQFSGLATSDWNGVKEWHKGMRYLFSIARAKLLRAA